VSGRAVVGGGDRDRVSGKKGRRGFLLVRVRRGKGKGKGKKGVFC
jgi:hypothetical protein